MAWRQLSARPPCTCGCSCQQCCTLTPPAAAVATQAPAPPHLHVHVALHLRHLADVSVHSIRQMLTAACSIERPCRRASCTGKKGANGGGGVRQREVKGGTRRGRGAVAALQQWKQGALLPNLPWHLNPVDRQSCVCRLLNFAFELCARRYVGFLVGGICFTIGSFAGCTPRVSQPTGGETGRVSSIHASERVTCTFTFESTLQLNCTVSLVEQHPV